MVSFFGCSLLTEEHASNDSIDCESAHAVFKLLTPKQTPYPLIRIGGNRDGAYLLPNDLKGINCCLSPGVNNFKYFEDELATEYGIPSDLVDASSDEEAFATPLIAGMQTFHKKWLDITGEKDCLSISQWLASKSTEQEDFLLQMDIEGAEYRNLLATPRSDLRRFRIIVMELHRLPIGFCRPKIFHYVLKPLLTKLDELFICVHAHPNNVIRTYTPPSLGVALPRILELTFLRRDRFPSTQSDTSSAVSLPHSLDITNVISRPPLHLQAEWMSGPRSLQSRLRMAGDWMAYYQYHKRNRNLRNLLQAQAKQQIKQRLSLTK